MLNTNVNYRNKLNCLFFSYICMCACLGISHVRNNDVTPAETNFALPVTTAGSFNRSLWTATGRQIGIEARAFMNAGNAYLFIVCIEGTHLC